VVVVVGAEILEPQAVALELLGKATPAEGMVASLHCRSRAAAAAALVVLADQRQAILRLELVDLARPHPLLAPA
jgi:hypothetical protein